MHDELTRRCAGVTRGRPCNKAPMVGGTVCRSHAGTAPQTLAAARKALAHLREPAIEVLNDFIEAQPTCDHCGRSDNPSVRLRAALAVLNRTGLAETVHIEVEHTDPMDTATVDDLADRAKQLLEMAADIRRKELEELNIIDVVPQGDQQS